MVQGHACPQLDIGRYNGLWSHAGSVPMCARRNEPASFYPVFRCLFYKREITRLAYKTHADGGNVRCMRVVQNWLKQRKVRLG